MIRTKCPPPVRAALLAGALLASAAPALAQRSAENAVASADDAFGSSVGNEKTGIYNENDIRGFNPVRAGNIRVDGVYFDQQAFIATRARAGSRIRVGVAALDYPFPAPTGIVDFQLRAGSTEPSASVQVGRGFYGGETFEIDIRGPVLTDRLTVTAGFSYLHDEGVDGSGHINYGGGLVPRLALDDGEVTLFVGHFGTRGARSKVVAVASGPFLPPMPAVRRHLGQEWAIATSENTNVGGIWRQDFGGGWSLRSGAFWSRILKHKGYSEIFNIADATGAARHSVTADPAQRQASYSGEAQLTWARDNERVKNRVIFTVRARDKLAESGGADRRDLGAVLFGELDPEPRPDFVFRPVDQGRVRQTTGAVGYMGRLVGVGQLNLGLQKTRYRASFERPGAETATTDTPWLYNATAVLAPGPRWLAYVGYVRGLEESGVAPETATNRNETLPAARTTQIEGGARVRLGTLTAVASAFQIEKPYFSSDTAGRFTALGDVRHRGVEASVAGTVDRFTILAGGLLMKPEVTGEARVLGRVGARPVGVPATLLRLDGEYRTTIKGLSLTTAVVHTGRRAASARPYAELGGGQLFAPAFTTVDIGARYRFVLRGVPMSARVTLANVFDSRSWRVVSPNNYQLNDTRRLQMFLLADF